MSIAALLSLLIYLAVIGLILWLAWWVLTQFSPPEPLGKVLRAVVIVVGVICIIVVLLNFLGIGPILVAPPVR